MARPSVESLLIDGHYLSSLSLDAIQQRTHLTGIALLLHLYHQSLLPLETLYQITACHYGIPYWQALPVTTFPLIVPAHHDWLRAQHLLPWKISKGTILCVTDTLTVIDDPMVQDWLCQHYGLRPSWIVTSPPLFNAAYQTACSTSLLRNPYVHYWSEGMGASRPPSSASIALTLGSLVVALFFYFYEITTLWLIAMALVMLLKCYLITIGLWRCGHPSPDASSLTPIDESQLPCYTLLIPLLREYNSLAHLMHSLRRLDYPPSKLDIIFITNEHDSITHQALHIVHAELQGRILEVPYYGPETKPKACNYALSYARGDYITIYDAEDMPDPGQLKKALHTFLLRKDPLLACVQARLYFFHPAPNWLASQFSLEYASWFRFILPALDYHQWPMPLGGTSNHFKSDILRALGGWNPFNVTEDAEIGVRLAMRGYHTTIISSTTLEAPATSVTVWIAQRSRWIKGFLQTASSLLSSPLYMWRQLGTLRTIIIIFFIGVQTLFHITLPLCYYVFCLVAIGQGVDTWNLILTILLWSGLAYIMVLTIGVLHYVPSLRPIVTARVILTMPLYYLLHSIAGVIAIIEWLWKPHYWRKTPH